MWADLADLFTDDASANYPAGVFVGRPSIRNHLFKNFGTDGIGLGDGRIYNHMNLQPVVHLDPGGQSAKGRWRALAMFGRLGGARTGPRVSTSSRTRRTTACGRSARSTTTPASARPTRAAGSLRPAVRGEVGAADRRRRIRRIGPAICPAKDSRPPASRRFTMEIPAPPRRAWSGQRHSWRRPRRVRRATGDVRDRVTGPGASRAVVARRAGAREPSTDLRLLPGSRDVGSGGRSVREERHDRDGV